MTNTGFIIGAYPCAPSFHQKGEQEEQTFWRELSDTPNIRGLEQPCLENLHPLVTNGCSAIPRGLANRGHGSYGNHAAPRHQRRVWPGLG
jgi:hypothetical protein